GAARVGKDAVLERARDRSPRLDRRRRTSEAGSGSVARAMRPVLAVPLLALAACSGAAPPPSLAPREPPRSSPAEAPWAARVSIADGYEAIYDAAPPVVIRGATLLTATGRTIPRGTIILLQGKIAAVAEGDLPAPVGATVVDGTGKFV